MRKPVLVGAVLILAAAVIGGYWWYQHHAADAASEPAGAPQGGFAVPVEAASVEVGRVELSIPAVGSLRSNESVAIAPEIALGQGFWKSIVRSFRCVVAGRNPGDIRTDEISRTS